MKPFKLLGKLLTAAAPIAVGVVAGPAAGAGVAALMGTLGLTKKAGQVIEKKGITVAGKAIVAPGHRPHKAGVPALALLLPTLLAPYLPPELLELVKDPAILGALTVFWHQFTSGVGKAGNQGVDSATAGG